MWLQTACPGGWDVFAFLQREWRLEEWLDISGAGCPLLDPWVPQCWVPLLHPWVPRCWVPLLNPWVPRCWVPLLDPWVPWSSLLHF